MTAFTDYLDLRVAVSEQVPGRDISDVMPRFVVLAETFFNEKLRHERMLTTASLTVTSGEADLPTDYIEAYRVKNGQRHLSAGTGAQSEDCLTIYAIEGNKLLYGTGDATISLTYYAKLPTLTSSLTASNWLLAYYPDVYLYGVTAEAAKFLQERELADAMMTMRDNAMRDLRIMNNRRQWRDGVVRVDGATP